ncbi:apolipoprotein L3-like [Hyperolius riggenbachi]|uniref:apolipoprotein L3-like n=1 Tax=Hyperolius riggenbachi TaxID=752182 RepID=UPI0035A2CC4A
MAEHMEKVQMILEIAKLAQQYEDQASLLETAISQCVNGLLSIADDIDKFHKGATITNVVGSSLGIAGGITTIVGLCLAPVTFGASLIVSGVGIGVATAGGITGASASIADIVNMKNKCKNASERIDVVNEIIKTMQDLAKNITGMVESLRVVLEVEEEDAAEADIARIAGRGVFVGVEIGRLAQLGRLSTIAARGVELAAQGARALRVVSGVFAALFVIIDVAFVAKAAIELQKGAKTIEAAQIREQAHSLLEIQDALKKNVENMNFEKTKFVAEMFR